MTDPDRLTQPTSLPEQIADQLLQRIVSGRLQPGDRLIELRIAKEMGTSQAPVREALRQLEARGLIAFRRNRGAVVRRITDEELRDIYAVRAELEGYAAQIAARDPTGLVPELATLCDAMDACVLKDDLAGFAALNAAFHRAIVHHAGNPTLLSLWEGLDVRLQTTLNTARSTAHLAAAGVEHRHIAACIGQGDAAQAREAMTAHINAVVAPHSSSPGSRGEKSQKN